MIRKSAANYACFVFPSTLFNLLISESPLSPEYGITKSNSWRLIDLLTDHRRVKHQRMSGGAWVLGAVISFMEVSTLKASTLFLLTARKVVLHGGA